MQSSCENLEITLKERWESIYKICFYSVLDNDLIWFQYRVLFKILGTKDYLKKLKLNMNSQCLFCKQYEENLEHLFCKCGEVIKWWENVRQWISNKLGFNLIITKLMKILGYLTNDENFWALNLIVMVTQKYILYYIWYFGVKKMALCSIFISSKRKLKKHFWNKRH